MGGSTHRLAVPARCSVLPWWPWGTSDLLHHQAISVPCKGPRGSGVARLPFLTLGARVAKSSTALVSGQKWGWVACPQGGSPVRQGFALAPPAMLTLMPSSPFSPCGTEAKRSGCQTRTHQWHPRAPGIPSLTHLFTLDTACPHNAASPRVPFQATLALLSLFAFGAGTCRKGTGTQS